MKVVDLMNKESKEWPNKRIVFHQEGADTYIYYHDVIQHDVLGPAVVYIVNEDDSINECGYVD